ncbi:hypothetical protein [Streptomyces sp. 15-116A]|uniref:hypothetical protein n=1 Tax=Streptomyces sp. 15-116A TaxID=2259035 RepID=UPI0037D9C1B4
MHNPERVPDERADAWRIRDRGAALHRAASTGLPRRVPLPPAVRHACRALECAVHFVEHLPVDERPDGLRGVLGLVG